MFRVVYYVAPLAVAILTRLTVELVRAQRRLRGQSVLKTSYVGP